LAARNKPRFATVAQVDVPHGRNGKHKAIVSAILAELNDLDEGDALKIALTELGDSKENVRAALNRASHKLNRPLATAADAKFLYVWSTTQKRAAAKS
jgi:sirohydrochlorin ferrochelatase